MSKLLHVLSRSDTRATGVWRIHDTPIHGRLGLRVRSLAAPTAPSSWIARRARPLTSKDNLVGMVSVPVVADVVEPAETAPLLPRRGGHGHGQRDGAAALRAAAEVPGPSTSSARTGRST
jgi:hypothetical protein